MKPAAPEGWKANKADVMDSYKIASESGDPKSKEGESLSYIQHHEDLHTEKKVETVDKSADAKKDQHEKEKK